MKKLFVVFTAVAMVMAFAMTASAASVGVTLTSPTITEANADVCEKAGAVTFEFPGGTVLKTGDWWYMDLPNGATLCKPIDYMITGFVAPVANAWILADKNDPTNVIFGPAAVGIGAGANLHLDIAHTDYGPFTVEDQDGSTGGNAIVAGNVVIRVIGAENSRRVTLYVATDEDTSGNAGTITVTDGDVLRLKILDGQAHRPDQTGADAGDTMVIMDRDRALFADYADALSQDSVTATGTLYSFGANATLDDVDDDEYIEDNEVPNVENTLCINAYGVGNVFVSFASKNDFLTFSGDSQIAHVGSALSITLETCTGKTAATNDILESTQSGCAFDYETAGTSTSSSTVAGANNYCNTHVETYLYLAADDTFGDLDERYDLEFEILTAGVYFSGRPTAIRAFASAEDLCDSFSADGTDVNPGVGSWKAYMGSTLNTAGYADDSCSVASNKRVNRLVTFGGAITNIHNAVELGFNFADFTYDGSLVTVGTEVDLQVTLHKYPCGEIFHDDITIGTFVAACSSTTASTTTLFFPFLPGSNFVGWWGGYVISNASGAAGTATLTATDVNGNSATYTTESPIPANGQFNASFLEAADWTQSASNTANFDYSESYTVSVTCNFTRGTGMAMLGNGTEGVGYTAYSTGW